MTPRSHDELPIDVALGKVDYIEVVGFSNHRQTANGLVSRCSIAASACRPPPAPTR